MNDKKEIEISFDKSVKNTYLNIKNVIINHNSYETKILQEEEIENILKFQIIYEENNEILRYNISNLITLEEYLKLNKLKSIDLKFIIKSIDSILNRIENYLLSENSIYLETNTIFVDRNGIIKLKFVAIPNFKSDFSYQLSKLLIRLLRHVDVNDKLALPLAYKLFVKSSKDNFTINDLLMVFEEDEYKTHIENEMMINNNIELEVLNIPEEEKEIDYEDDTLNEINSTNQTNIFSIKDIKNNRIENNNYESINGVFIDKSAKDLLKDDLFDNFDNESELKSRKKLNNKKLKTSVGSINTTIFMNILNFFKILSIPLLMIIVPFIAIYIYGMKQVIDKSIYLIIYEISLVIFFIINKIIDFYIKDHN